MPKAFNSCHLEVIRRFVGSSVGSFIFSFNVVDSLTCVIGDVGEICCAYSLHAHIGLSNWMCDLQSDFKKICEYCYRLLSEVRRLRPFWFYDALSLIFFACAEIAFWGRDLTLIFSSILRRWALLSQLT